MAINILGALTLIFYYIAVVTVGVWSGRKMHIEHMNSILHRRTTKDTDTNAYLLRLFLASRRVPLSLSFASMTATWVGGGYLNGTAEAVFIYGIVWCHAPVGYALSLLLGGWLFAGKMRITKSLTMLDPFQRHYGPWIAVMLCVPAICGEIFWTASILAALGDTMRTIVNFNSSMSIIVSAAVILFYTALGGFYSVVYTDAFQMTTTAIGLWAAVPYFWKHSAVGKIGAPHHDWIGKIEAIDVSQILDLGLMTVFGGIPWQVYFQRVLGAQDPFTAKMLSYVSAFGCLFLAVPPAIAGAVAKTTNFTDAGYPGPFNLDKDDRGKVLPLVMHYLTPSYLSTLGLIAITAAIMSSVDSSMLSASSLVTRNIYHSIFRPAVSMVLRLMVVVIGAAATFMALSVQSVFSLWTLSSDLVYVLLFPQFVALFYFENLTNAYGSFVGFVIGFILRGLCGEPLIHVPVTVQLPLYDNTRGQQFPFRTVCMVISLATMLGVSVIAKTLFATGALSTSMDVWHCFGPHPEDEGSKKAADRPSSDAKMTTETATSHTTRAGETLRKRSVAQAPGATSSQNRPPKDAVSPNLSQTDKTVQKAPRKKSTKKASKEAQDATETTRNKK